MVTLIESEEPNGYVNVEKITGLKIVKDNGDENFPFLIIAHTDDGNFWTLDSSTDNDKAIQRLVEIRDPIEG